MKNGHIFKRFLTIISMLALLLPSTAYAMSELEWNRTCWFKTKSATPIYERITIREADVENVWPEYEWHQIDTLPANAYVNEHSRDDGTGYIKISYYKNGGAAYAYIKMSPYPLTGASEYVQVVEIGKTMVLVTEVPEAYLNDKAALRKYIQEMRPGCRLLEDDEKNNLVEGPGDSLHIPGNTTDKQPTSSSGNKKPSSSASSSGSKKTSAAVKETVIVRYETEAVELLSLGVATSAIRQNSEEKTVPTAQLEFGSTAEKDQQIAVIHAPKTGKCTLRAKASDSGKALQKCKAGTVVMVLEYGRNFCKISDDGAVGYVQTDCLKWYDAETEGTGLLSYNGRATGSTTINVRNAAAGDSAKIAEWKTGTEVEVFGLENGWYEIEYKGIHGFVMEKYLTLQE